MITESDIKRFNSKFTKVDPQKCWEWKAHISTQGYGVFWWNGSNRVASRISYMIHHGVAHLDKDVEICHTCDNPPCVNPNHLFFGNAKVNAIDRNKKNRHNIDYSIHNSNIFKTHCKWGHLFDDRNTGIRKNGNRYCKDCKNRRTKERNERLKGIK